MRPTIELQVHRGCDLTSDVLVEANAFRRSVMTLKPHVDPAADFVEYASACRQASFLGLIRARGGALVGSALVTARTLHHAGTRYKLLVPNYTFLRPEFRGHPSYRWLTLRMFLGVLAEWRGEPLLVGGVAYPASTLALARILDPVHLHGDADVPALERHALDHVLETIGGDHFDPDRGTVEMPTIPATMSSSWHARAERYDLHRRYLARCPNWAEGYALACVARVRPARVIARVGWFAISPRSGAPSARASAVSIHAGAR